MIWQHLRTVLWLRWRIRVNQIKRLGTVNAVITGIFFGLLLLLAFMSFLSAIPVGQYVVHEYSPLVLLAIWDGLACVFLLFWMIGVVTELQRSETVSPEKFLHLPVPLSGVFLINYVSSWMALSVVYFLPTMVGLAVGLALDRGPALLWALPLITAFFLMVTALTYQFRGWLAAMMSNPRRRRSIIFGITFVFVGLAQLPTLISMWSPGRTEKKRAIAQRSEQETELWNKRQTGQITPADYLNQVSEIRRIETERAKAENEQSSHQFEKWALLGNQVLPPGWLPWGVMSAAQGIIWPALAGIFGMTLISTASLWRSYRTTIRYYTGQFNQGTGKLKTPKPVVKTVRKPSSTTRLLERRVPLVSEYASAIAVSCFRSIVRAPEAKMMLLSPIILAFVFGSMLFREASDIEKPVRSIMAIGAVAMTFFGMVQFVGNQFGFDRGGFRVFVLCPAPRRDILLGKNLSMAPLALGMSWLLIALVQVLRPMHLDHLAAMVPQSIAMFLVFCMMANWLSIFAPMPIAAGSMKPRNPRVMLVLLQVLFTFMLPLAMAPTILPWLAEFLLVYFQWMPRLPVFLVGSLLQLAAIGLLYHVILTLQGDSLQSREQKILEVVSKASE